VRWYILYKLNVAVKELKSVNIYRSYHYDKSGTFYRPLWSIKVALFLPRLSHTKTWIVTVAHTDVSGAVVAGKLVPDKKQKYLPSIVSETVYDVKQRAEL